MLRRSGNWSEPCRAQLRSSSLYRRSPVSKAARRRLNQRRALQPPVSPGERQSAIKSRHRRCMRNRNRPAASENLQFAQDVPIPGFAGFVIRTRHTARALAGPGGYRRLAPLRLAEPAPSSTASHRQRPVSLPRLARRIHASATRSKVHVAPRSTETHSSPPPALIHALLKCSGPATRTS